MARLSRLSLNFVLLLVSVSGQFSLHEFIEIIGVGINLQQIFLVIFHVLKHLSITILINAVSNIRELYAPVAALVTTIFWITFGHSCKDCDELYKVYMSAPSDTIFGRLWYFFSTPEHKIHAIVLSLVVTRLIAQWRTFLFLFKLHKLPQTIQSRKNNSTVIIPVADIEQQQVEECLISCLLSKVAAVFIVTSKDQRLASENAMDIFRKRFPETRINVITSQETEKCDMILEGIRLCDSDLVVLVDPKAFWPYRFLDRLLSSLEPKVGFAMIHQRIRRFRLPFTEVSPPIAKNPAFPPIGLCDRKRARLYDKEHVARAIVCRTDLLQKDGFRELFRGAQLRRSRVPREPTSYDEERGAAFLENWVLKQKIGEAYYRAVKFYAGHDAFAPPTRETKTPASDIWTHQLFNCYRYMRQAIRVRLRYLLIPATEWVNLPHRARTGHGLAFFIAVLAVDVLVSLLIVASPQLNIVKRRLLADAVLGSETRSYLSLFAKRNLRSSEAIIHTLAVWLHGRVRIWAGIYLFFNILGEVDGDEPVLSDRSTQTERSSSDGDSETDSDSDPEDDDPNDTSPPQDPPETQSVPNGSNGSNHSNGSDQSNGLNRSNGASPSASPNDSNRSNSSNLQPPDQNAPPTEVTRSRASPPSSKESDPVQRVRDSPLYRPGSPPLTRDFGTQTNTSSRQGFRPRSLSPAIMQTRPESSHSRPNTPNESSPLREEIYNPFQQRWSLSGSPPRNEQRSGTPVLSPRAQRSPSPVDELSEPTRRTGAARRRASDDEEYRPESNSNRDGSPSAQGSHKGSPLRQPSFTPSERRPNSTSPTPRLGSPLRTFTPPRDPEPQEPPVKRDHDRGHTPARTANTTIGKIPELPWPQYMGIEPPPAAGSPSARSKAKAKAKRAPPRAAVDSSRKRRCSKCRRLHSGECLEE